LVDGLPPFLAAQNLKPFISEDLMQSTTPIIFRTQHGAALRLRRGVVAEGVQGLSQAHFDKAFPKKGQGQQMVLSLDGEERD
jgi:hypothetical protein